MSFPVRIQGRNGDQFANRATTSLPLGTIMELPDGREFVHARAGAVDLEPSKVMQQAVKVSGHEVDMVTAAAAVGATEVTVTPITNNVTANQYAQGYLFVNDEAGEGHCYKIKSHPAITATSTGVITLEDEDGIQVALTSSSQTGLRKHPCDGALVAPTTETGSVIGVTVCAVTAEYYCWLLRKGTGTVLTNGTAVVGEPVTRSTAVAGAVSPYNEDGTTNLKVLGDVETVGADAEYSLVNFDI